MARRRARRHHGNRHGGFHVDFDTLAASISVPIMLNGKYTHTGNQMTIITQLQNFSAMITQQQEMALTTGMMFVPVSQIELLVIGSKTKAANRACIVATALTGSLCIFPLFFMCCSWWKKIASDVYEIRNETYVAINIFLASNPQIKVVNLKVVDNTFNSAKARIVYETVDANRLTGFTLQNFAAYVNQNEDEYDSFVTNMMPIKSLPTMTICSWGSQILP